MIFAKKMVIGDGFIYKLTRINNLY